MQTRKLVLHWNLTIAKKEQYFITVCFVKAKYHTNIIMQVFLEMCLKPDDEG